MNELNARRPCNDRADFVLVVQPRVPSNSVLLYGPVLVLLHDGCRGNGNILTRSPLKDTSNPVRPVQAAGLNEPTRPGMQVLSRPIRFPCRRRVRRSVCKEDTKHTSS